jgi:hypothetical protein
VVDSFVQVATDGSGKKVQSYSNTVNAVADIHAQSASLVDQYGVPITSTGLRDLVSAQRYTVMGDSLADGLAGWWTTTLANGGTFTSTGGEGRLLTSTAAAGSAVATSPTIPYLPGQVSWVNSAIRFGDTGVAGNIRRLGMYTHTAGTPQEGFYFELDGTSLYAVTVKGGSATRTLSTSWSKFADDPFTLTADYVSFEIRYTANTVWFYVNNVMRHVVSGTAASLTTSLSLPITIQNTKTSGATDITFAVRNIGNGRFGTPPTKDGRAYRDRVAITFQSTATATADTLLSLVKTTNGVAAGGATSIGVATGKTLRLTNLVFGLAANAAAAAFGVLTFRQNPTGATLIGSPSEWRFPVGLTAATVGSTVSTNFNFPEGYEFSGVQTFGLSLSAQATTNIISVALIGYEY